MVVRAAYEIQGKQKQRKTLMETEITTVKILNQCFAVETVSGILHNIFEFYDVSGTFNQYTKTTKRTNWNHLKFYSLLCLSTIQLPIRLATFQWRAFDSSGLTPANHAISLQVHYIRLEEQLFLERRFYFLRILELNFRTVYDEGSCTIF